jgi:hypothetical protein
MIIARRKLIIPFCQNSPKKLKSRRNTVRYATNTLTRGGYRGKSNQKVGSGSDKIIPDPQHCSQLLKLYTAAIFPLPSRSQHGQKLCLSASQSKELTRGPPELVQHIHL